MFTRVLVQLWLCQSTISPAILAQPFGFNYKVGLAANPTVVYSQLHIILSQLLGIKVVTNKNSTRKRVYDKRYCCVYCNKLFAKLPPHLEKQQPNEPDVAKLISSKTPSARKDILKHIRNLGSHKHNSKVLKKGEGELLVVYRQKTSNPAEKYVPCPHCTGYYKTDQLWKHSRSCNKSTASQRPFKRHVQAGRLLLATQKEKSDALHQIIQGMSNDEVSRCVKQDPLILRFGEKLCLKHGHNKSQHQYIRNSLRELGRLLLVMKTSHTLRNLEDFLKPPLFMSVIEAAREVSGFNKVTNTYSTPSLALKIGHRLKKCCLILKAEALQQEDQVKLEAANGFYSLLEIDWKHHVSSNALRSLNENRKNKVNLLPLTEDVKCFSDFLRCEIKRCVQSVKTEPECRQTYMQLQKSLLALLILFNRRRAGEASKMTLSEYQASLLCSNYENDIELSAVENALIRCLHRVEITGKRGRTVPVLLNELMHDSLKTLMDNRSKVGISPDNHYIFACLSGDGYIRGSDVLRTLSDKCGAKRPDALRSTKLRKHIATLTQIVNLKNHELDALATFMGHDIRVHREFYRLPEQVMQTAKVSKLLLAAETGQLQMSAGKSLDDIEIDANDDLEGIYC
jgi:hypothetical protein